MPHLRTQEKYTAFGYAPPCRCLCLRLCPFPPSHTRCFSEAAKLLIKAFAFYIWRTHLLYIYRIYDIYLCMGCHLRVCMCVCGRFGHNRAASYATKMRIFCFSFYSDALRIPRATQRSAVKRFRKKKTPYTPSSSLLLPLTTSHILYSTRKCVQKLKAKSLKR